MILGDSSLHRYLISPDSVVLVTLAVQGMNSMQLPMNGLTLDNFANNNLTDKLTESQWDFEGKSIEGPLKGKQLLRLPFDQGYWFEWAAFHPETKVYS